MVTRKIHDVINFKYRNFPETVVALKGVSEFSVHGTTYGPYEENQEFEVPNWVAEILIAKKLVRFKKIGVAIPDLQKTVWRETGESALQDLPSNYFFQIKQALQHLALEIKTTPNDLRQNNYDKMTQLFRDLLTSRLLKLMKISLWEERLRKAKKKMTDEEQWLIDRLVILLRNWQQQLLEVKVND